ncbi:DinB family protein [Sphaerobacter sp.]|uniref:DinB family protein n=1 Tax=Sphaerobacter sp. TaxID=2099654 RepID=UPI001D1A7D63|nr:DinB family protein [Sphaerobacter sp.]MBX5445604.1 DinB family protein [Sphaerobacter sp.]
MDGLSILRAQLSWTHGLMEQAVADLSEEQLHHCGEGWTIRSIAAIYAHCVQAEDWLVNQFLRKQPPVFERENWAEQTGILPFPARGGSHEEWEASLRGVNFPRLRAFAERVYAATDDYLGSLTEADLDQTVTFGRLGDIPVGTFLANIVAGHAAHHTGEVCALKGVLGGKGLPF